MAHFAKVVDGKVEQVIVADSLAWCEITYGGTWVQTSYNTLGNQYVGDNKTETVLVENPEWVDMPYPEWCGKERYIEKEVAKKPLHKNYAGVGYHFDGVGFYAPQPYPSWILNKDTYLWEAPTPMPEDGIYGWDEESQLWVEIPTE